MMTENGRTFQSKQFEKRICTFFRSMRQKAEFCDATLYVTDKEFLVHRIVIAASIPYYRSILSDNSSDSEERNDENIINVPDAIDPDAFESLMEFAYSGEIIITNENVKRLLSASLYLDVKDVTEACCEFLVDSLSPENVLNIRDFAWNLKCLELVKHVDDYICENFIEVSQKEEFCSLPLQCIEELLNRDDLRVSNEENVFACLMKWANKRPEDRKASFPELLKKVRMTLLNPRYLKDFVASEHLVQKSIPCRDLLDEALWYYAFPDLRQEASSFPSEPRCKAFSTSSLNNECLLIFSVASKYTAQHFNQDEQKWEMKASRTFHHSVSSSVTVGKKVYHIDRSGIIEYDPPKNVYKFCTGLRCYKYYNGAASLNGKIYLCGGQNASSFLKTVECYDPEVDSWENVSDMRECRNAPGVTTLAKSIYVLGGANASSILKSVEKYDLQSEKWRVVPSMLTERCSFGCTTLNGRIYACGGLTSGNVHTPTAEVYDPIENKWMMIPSMNTSRGDLILLSYHGKLYAIGGEDTEGHNISAVEIYDPNTNEWKFGKEINRNDIIASAAVISSTIKRSDFMFKGNTNEV